MGLVGSFRHESLVRCAGSVAGGDPGWLDDPVLEIRVR